MIFALVNDFFFRAKLDGIARLHNKQIHHFPSILSLDGHAFAANGQNSSILIIIDLTLINKEFQSTEKMIKNHLSAKIIGFYPHADLELGKEAKKTGIEAMPRSVFFNKISEIMKDY